MTSLSNQIIAEEHLTVVVGTSLDVKLLGVPAYHPEQTANREILLPI